MIRVESIFNFSKSASFSGFSDRLVVPYSMLFVVAINIRNVLGYILNVADACYSSFVSAMSLLIKAVLSFRNVSKIAPPVVRAIVINVINFAFWLLAGHERKYDAMSFQKMAEEMQSNVAMRINSPSNFTCKVSVKNLALRFWRVPRAFNALKHIWGSRLPSKLTSIGTVVKDFTKKVSGWYFMRSHFVLLNRANRLVDEGVGAPLSTHFNIKKASYGH